MMAVRDIVVVGGSAGSIEILCEFVAGLPENFPGSIFVVVHFPGSVRSTLPRILTRAGSLPARHPQDGESIEPGCIYVAPPNVHLVVAKGHVHLFRGPKENGHRPAVDPLFRSAAQSYGTRVVGIILSGNLNDGTAGLLRIKQCGGVTLVQDPKTALYQGMPRSAIDHVPVDHVLPAEDLAALVTTMAMQPVELEATVSEELIGDTLADEVAIADRQTQPGVPSTMACPECHGVLWENTEDELVQFRCRVGHAYSAQALLVHQSEQVEAALWTGLRALEEHSALARRLAARAETRGHHHSASAFTERAMDAEHHASVIRNVLDAGVRIQNHVEVAAS
jgi:two-component system chemotaxis response regulator CheB